MRYRQSNWAALTGIEVKRVPQAVLIGIRDAMLQALGEFSPVRHFMLDMDINFAEDIDQLWNLRSELYEAMKSSYGEDVAQERLQRVTQKFVGHHPQAKVTRLRHWPSATA